MDANRLEVRLSFICKLGWCKCISSDIIHYPSDYVCFDGHIHVLIHMYKYVYANIPRHVLDLITYMVTVFHICT